MRVSEELTLEAGACEEIPGPYGLEQIIYPPKATLFQQVLAYLRQKPDPPKPPSGSLAGREGVAAAALVLRWGSYLSVLLDHNKPIWPETGSASTSRISDEEMARINIEASAAFAEWVDLFRTDLREDPDKRMYVRLVNRAVAYLPMPKKTSKVKVTALGALAEPEIAARLIGLADASRLERVHADVKRHPSRVLANAIVHSAWRNGPVENIHAGEFRGYPLDQRRVSLAEERDLMAFVSERLADGMTVCLLFEGERPRRPWEEQVLPYGLAELLGVTPSMWTLSEVSREVRLPAGANAT